MKFVGEIPVRMGSKRVKQKNIRLINQKPMVAYAIESAKKSKYLDSIYINSESNVLKKISNEYNVNFYKRKKKLASDNATSDEFNFDFLSNIDCDAVVMINPVSPLILSEDIDNAIQYFIEKKLDTLITVKEEKLQSFYKGKAINININERLAKTQDIVPVQICSWAVTIWRKKTFIESYKKNGFAVFNGKLGFFPLNPLRALKVSDESEFQLVEYLIKLKESEKDKDFKKIEYYNY